MSAFVNYALTLGQGLAADFGYASLGEPLEHFAINEVAADVPGAVPMTATEQAFYDCGDLTPADAAAGIPVLRAFRHRAPERRRRPMTLPSPRWPLPALEVCS